MVWNTYAEISDSSRATNNYNIYLESLCTDDYEMKHKSYNDPDQKPNLLRLGVISIALGIILFSLKSYLIQLILESLLVLKPHSIVEAPWRKMPIEIPTDVYFFNWTNPADFHNISVKPKFEEVGPYRFMQTMEKTKVVWNKNNTVTYNQVRYWHFDADFTKGTMNDSITSLNTLSLFVSHYTKSWNYFLRKTLSIFLATTAPYLNMTRPVNQYLVDGYNDFFLDIANYLPFIAKEIPRVDKFGWFRLRNASETFDGVFNIDNGINGSFELRNWNYQNVTPYFNGSCAKVHGSATELYSLNLKKDYVDIFISDVCRPFRFDFEKEVMVDGILGYQYSLGQSALDNGTLVPGNECYCAGDCIPSGMINISSCRYGLPTYVSLPNFYQTDPVYLNDVEGMKPNKSKHETYIVLEPITSLPLKAVGRLQFNVLVYPIADISVYRDVRTVYFPLIWMELQASIPYHQRVLLKIFLSAPYIALGLSLALVLCGVYFVSNAALIPMLCSKYAAKCKEKKYATFSKEETPLRVNMDDYTTLQTNVPAALSR